MEELRNITIRVESTEPFPVWQFRLTYPDCSGEDFVAVCALVSQIKERIPYTKGNLFILRDPATGRFVKVAKA